MKSYLNLTRFEGNERLFEAVEMSILSSTWGVPLHIHAEGLRGTGKTTIMRAAKEIMPPMERIKGCIYNCDPENPHCPEHRHLSTEEIKEIGTEVVPRPFLEISPSAKIGTIVGSIDLSKLTDNTNPSAAMLPGIIPQAHRGVIFIDEINRLADTAPELTDVLLDVMGTKPGRVQIEETGLPIVELPVQVSVWAASNPDEDPGPLQEIRRQLSDRFDFVVDMGRSRDVDAIVKILEQSEETRKQGFVVNEFSEDYTKEEAYRKKLTKIAEKYKELKLPDFLRSYIARAYVKFNLESLRAIEAIQFGAILSGALRQTDQVLISDVLKVMPMALQHRVEPEVLAKIINSPLHAKNNDSYSGYSENDVAATAEKDISSKSSLINIFKDMLGKDQKTPNQPQKLDSIQATPRHKAKSIENINPDDIIKTEDDLNTPQK